MADPWWHAPGAPRARGRAYTLRGMRNALIALTLTALIVGSMLTPAQTLTSEPTSSGGVRYEPASVRALAGQCDPVERVISLDSQIGTVPVDTPLTYQTAVPVAGWMSSDLPNNWSATPEQGVRALWEGRRILWLGAGSDQSLVEAARAAEREHPHWAALVLPWPESYPYQLEPGEVVAASWGVAQSCASLAPAAIDELFASAPTAPGKPGQTPPSLTETTNEVNA